MEVKVPKAKKAAKASKAPKATKTGRGSKEAAPTTAPRRNTGLMTTDLKPTNIGRQYGTKRATKRGK
jgi:hypothetical protein